MSASFSNFLKLKELGKGSFSTVYLVKRLTDSKEYAMKVVKITKLSEKERQNALNEIRILASIADSNIIGYKEAFFDQANNTLCIIMEFADGGDLLNKINDKKKNKEMFSEKEIWKFLIQMTKGLRSLHNLKILHRDLKCANIFLTKEGILKLGDLNVSKVTQKGMAVTQAGTPYYCAPEIWKASPYDKKCDIWSLGCVLYEIAAFRPPFRGVGMKDLSQRIFKGEFERIPKVYSNDLSDLIKACLKVNPNERPTCDEILDNPTIKTHFKEELGGEKKKSAISKAQLLNTIKLPKNLGCLKEKLPKANYNVGNNSFDEEDEFMQSKSKGTFYRCPSESDLKEGKNILADDFFKQRKQPPVVVERSRTPIGQRPNTPLVINENKNRYDLGGPKKVELANRYEVKQENPIKKGDYKGADYYKYELNNNNKYEVNKVDYIKKQIVDSNQNRLADYNKNPSKVAEIVKSKPDYPPKYEPKYDQKYDHVSNKQEYIYQKPSSAIPQSRPKVELEDKFKNNCKLNYERYNLEEKKREIEKNYEKPNYDKYNINPNPEKNRRIELEYEKYAQKPKADLPNELLKPKKLELPYDYQNRQKVIVEKPKNDYSIEYLKQKKAELEYENLNRNKMEVDPVKKMVQPQNYNLQKEDKYEKAPPPSSKPPSRPNTGSKQSSRPSSQAQDLRTKGNNNGNQNNNNIHFNNQYNQYNVKEEMKKVCVEKSKMMANKRLDEQYKQIKPIPAMLDNKENAFKRNPAFGLEKYK